jgi:ferredoxin-NADP reductase
LGRLTWMAGRVTDATVETPRVRSLTIEVPGWMPHRPGQHVDLRLTAEDGYQAVRSYSLAAPAEDSRVVVTVERIDDGEVSPWLVDEARRGDQLEVRGPVGGYFVWDGAVDAPLLLVAGGSGIVPLAAMLRHRAAARLVTRARLLYSVRDLDEAIFREDLDALAHDDGALDVIYTITRETPPGWTGYARRVDADMLREVAWPTGDGALAYVCGPTAFVEVVADDLRELGYDPDAIRTERFGPTGGER